MIPFRTSAKRSASDIFRPFTETQPRRNRLRGAQKRDGFDCGPSSIERLTLVREILSGHGFDYSLHKEPGEPTTFTIVF